MISWDLCAADLDIQFTLLQSADLSVAWVQCFMEDGTPYPCPVYTRSTWVTDITLDGPVSSWEDWRGPPQLNEVIFYNVRVVDYAGNLDNPLQACEVTP